MNPKAPESDRSDGSRKAWRKPELNELGNIHRIVQTGVPKTIGPVEGKGGGGGEEAMDTMN